MRVVVAFGIFVLVAGACSSFEEGADPTTIPSDGGDRDGDGVIDAGGNPPPPDGASSGADGGAPPDPSLLVYWKLDDDGDTAKDSVAKNDGTRTGGGWAAGQIGGAFSTGGTGFIKIAATPKLSPDTRFTFAAWINLDEQQNDSYIFTHGSSWYVKLNGRRPQLTMGTSAFFGVTKEVPAGGWHHIAVTFAAGVPAIWVDAAETAYQEGVFPDTTRPVADTDPLFIGSAQGGGTPAVGLIDDVRLYDRVLSESEIEVLALRK